MVRLSKYELIGAIFFDGWPMNSSSIQPEYYVHHELLTQSSNIIHFKSNSDSKPLPWLGRQQLC